MTRHEKESIRALCKPVRKRTFLSGTARVSEYTRKGVSPFLKLPRELRDMVYDQYLLLRSDESIRQEAAVGEKQVDAVGHMGNGKRKFEPKRGRASATTRSGFHCMRGRSEQSGVDKFGGSQRLVWTHPMPFGPLEPSAAVDLVELKVQLPRKWQSVATKLHGKFDDFVLNGFGDFLVAIIDRGPVIKLKDDRTIADWVKVAPAVTSIKEAAITISYPDSGGHATEMWARSFSDALTSTLDKIYRAMSNGFLDGFKKPWQHIALNVGTLTTNINGQPHEKLNFSELFKGEGPYLKPNSGKALKQSKMQVKERKQWISEQRKK
ncbi:hypothetical protein BU23DRAFT_571228 [Bimuria novae-zelandiae CBS 107.79]|uniref:Uncharacterized protein n=1 Tax=Bimuria novae-zelandiae CBS 107.79 TaxID=1447943 RepID=A0A6A5UYP8_9PLEO|nr:hypothetical protein BU23DRAFT_571228 [Bimuria novae-zelandiae CBS 107.79]